MLGGSLATNCFASRFQWFQPMVLKVAMLNNPDQSEEYKKKPESKTFELFRD